MHFTRTQLAGAVAAIGLVVPATAFAATIDGGPGGERLRGTNRPDTIDGNGGNDRIRGLGGADRLNGGAGDDTIFANRGVDVSSGGDGNDVLWALARADVRPGPHGETDTVADTLDGGNGDDVLRARDGEADTITCGPGNDRALLDTVDLIADATPQNANGSCEVVQRKAPRTSGSRAEDREERPAARHARH
jgi:Ca2+-binding RTX toxin-like protein